MYARTHVYTLRIVYMDKILHFTNTLSIIIIFIKAISLPNTCVSNNNNFHKVPFLTRAHCALLLFTLTANAKYTSATDAVSHART